MNKDSIYAVVDNDKNISELYQLWLEEYISTAETDDKVKTFYGDDAGCEFLDSLEEEEVPDVVILDRRMPDMDGKEVVSELENMDYETEVIYSTVLEPEYEELLNLSFTSYLEKPVGKDELISEVKTVENLAEYNELLPEYFSAVKRLSMAEELDKGEKVQLESIVGDLERELNSDLSKMFENSPEIFPAVI